MASVLRRFRAGQRNSARYSPGQRTVRYRAPVGRHVVASHHGDTRAAAARVPPVGGWHRFTAGCRLRLCILARQRGRPRRNRWPEPLRLWVHPGSSATPLNPRNVPRAEAGRTPGRHASAEPDQRDDPQPRPNRVVWQFRNDPGRRSSGWTVIAPGVHGHGTSDPTAGIKAEISQPRASSRGRTVPHRKPPVCRRDCSATPFVWHYLRRPPPR